MVLTFTEPQREPEVLLLIWRSGSVDQQALIVINAVEATEMFFHLNFVWRFYRIELWICAYYSEFFFSALVQGELLRLLVSTTKLIEVVSLHFKLESEVWIVQDEVFRPPAEQTDREIETLIVWELDTIIKEVVQLSLDDLIVGAWRHPDELLSSVNYDQKLQ